MFRARRQAEFTTWQAPGSDLTIVYSEAAMRLLAERALTALHSMPGRGLETGGILFGSADHDEVRITVSRPIYCSHAHGPAWILTEDEESELAANVEEFADDPELSGLVPVGLYVSHTVGNLELKEAETALFHRYFPRSNHIALLLLPAHGKPTRAGFFIRDGNGVLHTGPFGSEFVADNTPELPRPNGKPHIVPPTEPAPPPVPDPPVLPAPLPAPPEEILDRPADSRVPWKVVYALSVLALALAGGLFLWRMPRPAPPARSSVSLRIADRSGTLVALWNGQAPRFANVNSAALEVNDGSVHRVVLNRGLIESGEWALVTRSRDVQVKFSVGPSKEVIDTARYTGPPAAPAPAISPVEDAELAKGRDAVRFRQRQLQARLEENENLERRVETLREMVRLRLASPARQLPSTPVPAPKQQGQELLPAPPPASTPTATAPPASIAQEPVRPPAQPERPAPQFAERAAPRPSPPAAEPPKQPAYSGPASGRMIWTGALPPGASLTIDGRRVSTGSIIGALPSVPVRVGAYPMELGAQGFTVWTGNARHARGNTVEQPSARNGWQRTAYRYDPAKAGEIVVVEPPAGANNWNKVILRGGRGNLNALLIEWEVVQP